MKSATPFTSSLFTLLLLLIFLRRYIGARRSYWRCYTGETGSCYKKKKKKKWCSHWHQKLRSGRCSSIKKKGMPKHSTFTATNLPLLPFGWDNQCPKGDLPSRELWWWLLSASQFWKKRVEVLDIHPCSSSRCILQPTFNADERDLLMCYITDCNFGYSWVQDSFHSQR